MPFPILIIPIFIGVFIIAGGGSTGIIIGIKKFLKRNKNKNKSNPVSLSPNKATIKIPNNLIDIDNSEIGKSETIFTLRKVSSLQDFRKHSRENSYIILEDSDSDSESTSYDPNDSDSIPVNLREYLKNRDQRGYRSSGSFC